MTILTINTIVTPAKIKIIILLYIQAVNDNIFYNVILSSGGKKIKHNVNNGNKKFNHNYQNIRYFKMNLNFFKATSLYNEKSHNSLIKRS